MPSAGAVVAADKNWWILNPEAGFRLHVAGIDLSSAQRLQRALKRASDSPDRSVDGVLRVMGATAFRCYEIDLYRQDHGAVFERELDEMRKASPEWPKLLAMGDAAQNRRERLLASFQRDIVARWRALKYVPGLTSDDENTRLVTFADLLTVSYGLAEAALVRDRLRIDMANRRWSLALGPGQCCPSCAALVHETAYRRVPLHAGCACKMLTASMIPTHGTFR